MHVCVLPEHVLKCAFTVYVCVEVSFWTCGRAVSWIFLFLYSSLVLFERSEQNRAQL